MSMQCAIFSISGTNQRGWTAWSVEFLRAPISRKGSGSTTMLNRQFERYKHSASNDLVKSLKTSALTSGNSTNWWKTCSKV